MSMFKKPTPTPPPLPSPDDTLPPTRRFTDPAAPPRTLIGLGTHLKGDLMAEGPVEIGGKVDGDCRIEGLCRVREGGLVEGNVKATRLVVNGEVKGERIEAEKIEIGATGRVRASIQAHTVALIEGGFFEGHVDMEGKEGRSAPAPLKEKRKGEP